MKVCLLVPDFLSGTSFLQQPLDFLYTGTVLQRKGYDVTLLDCRVHHLSMSSMLNAVRQQDVIVVTTTPIDQVQNYFLDYRYAYAIKTVDEIRNAYPVKPIVVYGAHVSANSDLVIKDFNADFFIKGEVFETLPKLLDVIRTTREYESVPNIIFWKNGVAVHTKVDLLSYHPIIPDDILPAYDLAEMSQYFGVEYINNIPLVKRHRVVASGGRGCPFTCSFCHNYFGKKIHYRSPLTVAKELEICKKRFGVEEVFFLDEVFTLNKQWVHSLMREMKNRQIKLELTIQTRVDCIDYEVLHDLSMMGVKNIWLGMESMNDELLAKLNKEITTKEIKECIEVIRSVGIQPHVFFMIGVEGENEQTIQELMNGVAELNIPYTRSLMICTPRYGTPFFDHAKKQYPDIDNWFDLNRIKGLVANEMTPSLLIKAKNIFKKRIVNTKSW